MSNNLINQPTTVFDTDWNPHEYLAQYFSPQSRHDDERVIAKRLQAYVFKHVPISATAIEVGCGPTIHHAAALAPYVGKIHLADYLPSNLAEVSKWLNQAPDAYDWDLYLKRMLKQETHTSATPSMLAKRKDLIRAQVAKLLLCDLAQEKPLGADTRPYGLVTSFFCADSATDDKATWRKYMQNLFTLIAPGGHIFIVALEGSRFYPVGQHKFPSANITASDMRAVLEEHGKLRYIAVDSVPVKHISETGANHIIIASAYRFA